MKKRILLVADKPGWIFERHALEISQRLPGYAFEIAYLREEGIARRGASFDLVYLFDPFWIDFAHHRNVIMGVRAEWLYRDHPGGIRAWYEQRIHGRARMVHVLNQRQFDELRPVVREPLLLVAHGVDTAVFAPAARRPTRPFTVGIAGNRKSRNEKGIELVEEACRQLGLDVALAEQDFTGGHRNKAEMAQFYRGLDVYCCMSRSEGLCNPVLEAGASGVPLISTRCGIAAEIIRDGENGLLVERSVEALAAALRRLLDDPGMGTRLGTQLRATVLQDWSWDMRIHDFERMFEQFFALPESRWPRRWFPRRQPA